MKSEEYKRPVSIKELSASELVAFFKWMDFRDPLGHPLTLNQDFLDLICELEEMRGVRDLAKDKIDVESKRHE